MSQKLRKIALDDYLTEVSAKRNKAFCYRIRQAHKGFELVLYGFSDDTYEDEKAHEEFPTKFDDRISAILPMGRDDGVFGDRYWVIFSKAGVEAYVDFFM